MTTTVAPDTTSLEELEWEIACEMRSCGGHATSMTKGCADGRHYAICTRCLLRARQAFYTDSEDTICNTCHRPLLFFSTHFEVVRL